MSQFEYVAIGASILFALTLGRTLTAAPFLFGSRFDPLYTFVYFVSFCWQVALWWILWEGSSIQEWDFLGYVLFIGTPLNYFLVAQFLVPSDPENVESWGTYYHSVARPFAGLFAFTFVAGTSRVAYLGEMDIFGLLFPLPFLLIALVATLSKNRWAHWLLGVALLFFITVRVISIEAG